MELTFSEAAKGVNKELNVNIDDECPRCDGKGSEPGTKVSQCHYCNGTGMVSFWSCGAVWAFQALMFPCPIRAVSVSHYTVYYCLCFHLQESVNTGPFMMRTTCRRCGGKGSIINTPCALCRGSGQTKKRQTVTVPVPAGRFSSWNLTTKGLKN